MPIAPAVKRVASQDGGSSQGTWAGRQKRRAVHRSFALSPDPTEPPSPGDSAGDDSAPADTQPQDEPQPSQPSRPSTPADAFPSTPSPQRQDDDDATPEVFSPSPTTQMLRRHAPFAPAAPALPPLPVVEVRHWNQFRPLKLKTYTTKDRKGNKVEVQLPEGYAGTGYMGGGTFGAVVSARCEAHGDVVVKAIKCGSDEVMAESALRELHNLTFFTAVAPHVGLVKLLDCYYAKETLFLVMEKYAGTVYEVLTGRPHDQPAESDAGSGGDADAHDAAAAPRVSLIDRQRVALRLLDALRHIHRYGLVHRDLKPANIAVDKDLQRLAIIDLGTMRKPHDAMTRGPPLTPAQNCMTEGYASPEALKGKGLEYSREADNFNAGLVLAELIVGGEVFENNTAIRAEEAKLQLERHRRDFVRRILQSKSGVEEFEVELITLLLAAHPAARATANQALRFLCDHVSRREGAIDALAEELKAAVTPSQAAQFMPTYAEPQYDGEDVKDIKEVLKRAVTAFREWTKTVAALQKEEEAEAAVQ